MLYKMIRKNDTWFSLRFKKPNDKWTMNLNEILVIV